MVNERPIVLDYTKTTCWMINLLPFEGEDRADWELVHGFQMACKSSKVFGIGWHLSELRLGNLTEESYEDFLAAYEEEDSSLNNALCSMSKIKPGDYIITRLRDSHYYIGRINSPIKYNDNENVPSEEYGKILSWYGEVEHWAEFENDEVFPSELVGRFSRCYQNTIELVEPIRQRVLAIQAYHERLGLEKPFDSMIRIADKNLARSLSYSDLEDLVAAYIFRKNPGYMLMPSSCKLSHIKYEFTFVKDGEKPLTCQVKNQADLPPIGEYINETSYKKIYLYSGMYSNEQVYELRDKYNNYSQLEFISSSDLYAFFRNQGCEYMRHKLERFYQMNYEESNFDKVLKSCGYAETASFRSPKNKYKYINGDYYIDGWDLRYSEDLNAFVVNGDLDKYQNTISLLTEEMCK